MERRQEDVRRQMELARQLFSETISTAPLSKSALSDRAGWTRSHLYDILRGRADLKIVHILAIQEALGRPSSTFFEELAKRYRQLEASIGHPAAADGSGRTDRAETASGPAALEATIRRIVREELLRSGSSLLAEEETLAKTAVALAGGGRAG